MTPGTKGGKGGPKAPGYRIGSVSRLTGLSSHLLRMWERRYGVVTPQREGRNRLYSDADIAKLSLLKRLVDAGEPISTLAPLSLEQLQARLETLGTVGARVAAHRAAPVLRLAVVGAGLAASLQEAADAFPEFDVVASYPSAAGVDADAAARAPDLLLMEQPTVQPETARHVTELVRISGARHAFVVYRYAAAAAVRRLRTAVVTPVPAPLDLFGLRDRCHGMGLLAPGPHTVAPGGGETHEVPPPRRFSDAELMRAARIETTVQCECPLHLSQILSALCTFETYSAECESRSPKDAALHRYLHRQTAQARDLVEQALQRLLEVEGVELKG